MPTDVALVFNGNIGVPASVKLRTSICWAVNGANDSIRPAKLWLLLSSGGGGIEDGIAIYNLLRALPCEVITVNMGQIGSIGNVIFLAGKRRIACPESYFYFHDVDWSFAAAHTMTRGHATEVSKLLEIGRTNTKALLKQHTSLADEDFVFLDEPTIKDAQFAKDKGIVHEIALPNLPVGTPIYNVEY